MRAGIYYANVAVVKIESDATCADLRDEHVQPVRLEFPLIFVAEFLELRPATYHADAVEHLASHSLDGVDVVAILAEHDEGRLERTEQLLELTHLRIADDVGVSFVIDQVPRRDLLQLGDLRDPQACGDTTLER